MDYIILGPYSDKSVKKMFFAVAKGIGGFARTIFGHLHRFVFIALLSA
jgi:hypothetical protein